MIDEPVVISGFADFDVNQKGQYALAYDGIVKDRVLVYDAEGNWLWGFTFYNDGALYVRWNEDNILVYFVRSDVIVEVDKNGNCIGMWYVLDTPERYRYVDEIFDAKECTVNGDTYRAEHWLFTHELIRWGKYPRLVKITPEGEKTVLFDRTIGQLGNCFLLWAVFIGFEGVAAYVFIRKFGDKGIVFLSHPVPDSGHSEERSDEESAS